MTQEHCQDMCTVQEDVELCLKPKMEGSCDGNFSRWFYNKDKGQCESCELVPILSKSNHNIMSYFFHHFQSHIRAAMVTTIDLCLRSLVKTHAGTLPIKEEQRSSAIYPFLKAIAVMTQRTQHWPNGVTTIDCEDASHFISQVATEMKTVLTRPHLAKKYVQPRFRL